MKQFRILITLLSILTLSGCASIVSQEEYETCIWGTSIAGAAVGGAVGNIGGAAAGTAGGALIGSFICGTVGTPAPEPMMEEFTGNYIVPDDDNDGVPNEDDACPFTPPGVAVNPDGCANDEDGDGIPDYLDKCPGTPLGTPVDETGCSIILATLRGVHFDFDSATLTSEARSILDGALSKINADPGQRIVIEGHTDSTGDENYNMGLSQRRADSVKKYLESRGVSSSRMTTTGHGENDPVASNDSAAGRKLNRRVEILAP